MNRKLFFFFVLVSLISILPIISFGAESTIKIGADFELSGPVGYFGQSSVDGINLYFEQMNANGGVLGQKIELVVRDNCSTPDGAHNAAITLIENDKVLSILGPVTSRNCLSAAPVAQKYHVPLLTGTATNPAVTQVGNYIFRACFIDSYQGTVMARFAAKSLNGKTAAVIIDESNDYSKGLAKAFIDSFTELGGQIIAKGTLRAGTKDVKSLVKKVMVKNPDLIFAPLYYQEAGVLTKEIREQNINTPILGGDGWDSSDLALVAGANSLNNIFFCNHYSADNPNPLNLGFVDAYQNKYGKKPDAIAALGYDIAAMVVKAIETAGSAEPSKIRDAMAAIQYNGVTGNLTFDENRNPIKTGVVIEFRNGVQVLKEVVEPK